MDCNLFTEAWLDEGDIQQDLSSPTWQDEITVSDKVIKNPVHLFREFVLALSPSGSKDIEFQPEFSTLVQDLCEKAPSIAEYLVREILNHSVDDSQPQDSKEHESSTNAIQKSRRRKQLDGTYRPPKSRTVKPNTTGDGAEDSDTPVKCQSLGDGSVSCQPNHDNMTINQSSDSLMKETVQSLDEYKEVNPGITAEKSPQSAINDHNTRTKLALHLPNSRDNSDSTIGNIKESNENVQSACPPPSAGEVEKREVAIPEIDRGASDTQARSATSSPQGTELHKTTSLDLTISTPIKQIARFQPPLSDDQTVTPNTTLFTPTVNGEALSPLTEDDHSSCSPGMVEMALPKGVPLSLSSSTMQHQTGLVNTASEKVDGEDSLSTQERQIMSSSPSREPLTINTMVAEAIHLMHKMSKRQEEPANMHSQILSMLRSSFGGNSAPDVVGQENSIWSASMWINMLESGQARSKKVTILNMIEWMGASEWYDAELACAEKAPPQTKQGKSRKRLATVILDEYLKEVRDTTIGNPGKLTLDDTVVCPQGSAGVQSRIFDTRRKKLSNIFHKGRTLRKLVQMTHLGVLFDPNIWSYAKASKERLDEVVTLFREIPQKMELLSILTEQVELLVTTGRPDLSRFFDSLESHSIAISKEVSSLRAEYGFDNDPFPQSFMDTAFERIFKTLNNVIIKRSLNDDDCVTINGAVDISRVMLDRIQHKEWLKSWDIAAALEMADKPTSAILSLSIPLHKEGLDGKITPISNPFRRWKTTIDEFKREDKTGCPRVYLCPLNLDTNHFTLLEINQQTNMICHYDSMANSKIIHRKIKSTLVSREVKNEFGYLGFGYSEAPCPQQKDGWSCGLMVIRNAKCRMNGLPVGSWDDQVDPDRVIKEVLGDCQRFLENEALQPSSVSKKRKRVVEGLENNVPKRTSKRLKDMSEGKWVQ